MYCTKCGAQIKDNCGFCTKCGARLGNTAPAQTVPINRAAISQPQKRSKKPVIIAGAVSLCAVLLIGVIVLAGWHRDKTKNAIETNIPAENTTAAADQTVQETVPGQSEVVYTNDITAEPGSEIMTVPVPAEEPVNVPVPAEEPATVPVPAEEPVTAPVPASIPEEEPVSEYILADSASRYLTRADLQGLSAEECRLARNELYARYGRKFRDEGLQNHFNSCSWYHGTIEPDDFQETMLSEIEIANRDLIVAYETEMGYR